MNTELSRSYEGRWVWATDLVLALVAAYAIAVSAQLRVWLPYSPVPVTAQTLVVLLVGALAGRRRAVLAVGTYLVGGMAGLPFFAGNTLWGSTGGYLLGFLAAVYVLSLLMARGWGRSLLGVVTALLIGNMLIYLIGLPWLAAFVGIRAVLPLGFFPFVVGDLFKLTCAAGVVVSWQWWSSRSEGPHAGGRPDINGGLHSRGSW